MRMNLENASRSWGRPRVQECGDVRTHDDRDEEARQKSMYSASYLCDVTTTPYEAIVDNSGFFRPRGKIDWMKHEPNDREERETARGEQNSQGRDPRTCAHRRAVPTAGERYAEKCVEVNDKVWEKNLNVSDQDESKCDHQHESTGKLSQSEAKNFRDENEVDQSTIEIM